MSNSPILDPEDGPILGPEDFAAFEGLVREFNTAEADCKRCEAASTEACARKERAHRAIDEWVNAAIAAGRGGGEAGA